MSNWTYIINKILGVKLVEGKGTSDADPISVRTINPTPSADIDPHGNLRVSLGDSSSLDAFGRLRVSEPFLKFESVQKYDSQPLTWDTQTLGSGAISHDRNLSSTRMTVGTASGDSVIRQTRRYITYSPGRSHLVFQTGGAVSGKTGVRWRVGYFDAQNGIFYQNDSGVSSFVIRSSTTGVAVDIAVPQSNWSEDKLDGTGPSGIILDPSKVQIWVYDLEWLGVGRVRAGFVIDGKIVYCHNFNHANILAVPYMTTAKLPLRYEIVNTSPTVSPTTLLQTCGTVLSEGGEATRGVVRAVDTDVNMPIISAGVSKPLLSLRLNTSYNRATLEVVDVSLATNASNNVYRVQIILNGTLVGASWQNADGYAQFDRSSTSITGGTILFSGYALGNNLSISPQSLTDLLNVGSNIAGDSDVLSLVITTIVGGGNPSYSGSLIYREIV